MGYIVFARKWRPKTFDEIIGQSHIARILKNAIKGDRVAHAYIFSGPRGIGKTSAARILAKALNCEKGPVPDPCNKCNSCKEISESRSLDVLEIDGASNRGIDEIRNLRENIKFAPSHGKFKIYIIDEVHMLTQEAFNALLKTLEEPPPHVKFIFATTRPDKVLATILSRCQRFDFRKIPTKDIVTKLAHISKAENLKIAEDALFAIARAADGGMRDAESILDQLSSFADKKIEASNVTQVLGTLNEETLFEMVDAVAAKNASKALKTIDALVREGKDLSFVGLELIGHFRNLLVAKVGKDLKELIDLPEDFIKRLSGQSGNFTIEDLLYALNIFSAAYDIMRKSNISRVPLEMAIVKLTRKESIRPIGEIMDKISSLEEKINQGIQEPYIPKKPLKENKESVKPKGEATTKKEIEENTTEATVPEEEAIKHDESPKNGKITFQQIENIWFNVIKSVRVKKISIASCLLEGEPVSYEKGVLTLGFPEGYSFHKEVIEEAHNKKLVEEALLEMLGEVMTLKFTTIKERRNSGNIEPEESYPEDEPFREGRESASEKHADPIVDSALNIFKGRIINNKRNR